MNIRKILIILLSIIFSTSLLFSQSLVEVAKKEKERRARLKGKTTKVITNDDLKKGKKKTALTVMNSQFPKKSPIQEEKSKLKVSTEKEASLTAIPDDEKLFREKKAALEVKLKKANELASLLFLKVNSLWQELNSMDDMTSRDSILKEMEETQRNLETAQKEEATAKEELAKFLAEARKIGVPPGWIR